jgi:hypothetical protein
MKRSGALTIGSITWLSVTWLAYLMLARPLSLFLARRWSLKILQAGDGAFSDAAVFLHQRFFEAAWLLTLTVALLAVIFSVGGILSRKLPPLWKWIAHSSTAFVAANIWLKLAAGTVLFWCLFWNGKGSTDNFTQFHIKLLLMDESPAPVKVVLAGSSQVRTQIDRRALNRELLPNMFTTELHYPGNRSYDFLLLNRKLQNHKVNIIVCYLSELNFFSGGLSDGSSLFFNFSDWPEFKRLGGQAQWSFRTIGYGFLGSALPAFRLRDPVAQRFFGSELVGLRQRQQDKSLVVSSLDQRAKEAAAFYRVDAQSDFSTAALEEFVLKCRAENREVVLCCGQLNPVLGRKLDPSLRPKMISFLEDLSKKYDNVVLLTEKDLPIQTEADYEDLTHVREVAQSRFTQLIAKTLQSLSLKPSGQFPRPNPANKKL